MPTLYAIGGALVVVGVSLGVAVLGRRARVGDAKIGTLIRPPRYRWDTADEALETRARQRRAAADQVRRESVRITTTDHVERDRFRRRLG